MATEIIVDKAELQSCKNQIDALANTVRNRSFSVCFSAARGDTVTELSELAARLSEMRSALADVFAGTSASVANMIAAFETTDSKAAETFHFMGVITDDD